MTLVSIVKIVLFLAVWPCLAGAAPALGGYLRCQKDEFGHGAYQKGEKGLPLAGHVLLESYIWGLFILFALFEIVSVPMILKQKSFTLLCNLFFIASAFVCLLSLVFFFVFLFSKRRSKSFNRIDAGPVISMKGEKREGAFPLWLSIALWVIFGCLLIFQAGFMVTHQHFDGDDSYYIAQSVLARQYDTMFQRDSYTEFTLGGIDKRHALSALPMFIACLSEWTDVPVGILAHSMLGPVFLLTMYGIYFLLSKALLTKEDKLRYYTPLLLLFLSVWYLFGNVSQYTPETFAYTRIWQGKGAFANLLIPMLLFLLLGYYKMSENDRIRRLPTVLALMMVSISSVLFTTAGVFLVPILFGCFGLVTALVRRRFHPLMELIVACIPCLLFGVVYYMMR